jgi:hypothetical protein
LQHGDNRNFNKNIIENHIINSLRRPLGKLSDLTKVIPSRRYFEDYIYNYKFLNHLNVIGMSLNPEHTSGKLKIIN